MEYVIIGCGPAALHAARAIGKQDKKADITLISWELTPFYIRPAIVDYLSGEVNRESLIYRPLDILQGVSARFELGRRVIDVQPNKKAVRFSDGSQLCYDSLLIASGAKPRVESTWLAHREKFRTVRSLADIIRLKRSLDVAQSVVVVGGGYIALEIIRACHKKGLRVTYLTSPETFWDRSITGIDSETVAEKIESAGIEMISDDQVSDIIDRDGTGYRVITGKGLSIDVDLVILSAEHDPNIDFLEDSGLQLEWGVVVNRELRTSSPDIFAAGDVAQVMLPEGGLNRLNFGWRSACEQGIVAGTNMTGGKPISIGDDNFYFSHLEGKKLLERW